MVSFGDCIIWPKSKFDFGSFKSNCESFVDVDSDWNCSFMVGKLMFPVGKVNIWEDSADELDEEEENEDGVLEDGDELTDNWPLLTNFFGFLHAESFFSLELLFISNFVFCLLLTILYFLEIKIINKLFKR